MSISRVRRLVGAAIALVVMATLLATFSTSPASAGPGYQRPHVGECRNIVLGQIFKRANSTTPVACTEEHTAQTLLVAKLKKRFFKGPKRKLTEAVNKKCDAAWQTAVGRSTKQRLQSAYSYAWWIPTKAQRGQGARWFRCDIVLWGGKTALAPLTATSAPFLDKPIPDSQRLCLVSGAYGTTCDRPHSFRAVAVVKLKTGPWPGKAKLVNRIGKKCLAAKPEVDPYFYRPSRKVWETTDGPLWVRCYEKTTARLATPGVTGRQLGILPDPGVHSDRRRG